MTQRNQQVLLTAATGTGAGKGLSGDDRQASIATFTVLITGSATITWEASEDGGANYYAYPVTSVLASPVTATTCTASGIYRCDATNVIVRPNVTTLGSGTVTVNGSLVTGTLSGGVSSGGGGGGGAATVADGADVAQGARADAPQATAATTANATVVALLKGIYNNTSAATSNAVVPTTTVDPTNSFTQPTGDAAGRSLFTVTQGLIADGSTGTSSAAVLGGGLDSGGLVRTFPMVLGNATPAASTQYGLATYSILVGQSSAGTLRGLITGSSAADGGNGATTLPRLSWNGTAYDRVLGSIGAGTVTKPYALPASDWMFAGATGGLTTTTGVTMKAAAGASVRNYVTALQYLNTSATPTELVINDGAAGTALWRGMAPASMVTPATIAFPTPLKGTANTLTEVACVTTGSATRVSAQGYAAA